MRTKLIPLLCAMLLFFSAVMAEEGSLNTDGIYIFAVMASNRTSRYDEDGDSSDWIEIYNGSEMAAELDGYAVSDGKKYDKAWKLPSVTLKAGDGLVVFASGKNRSGNPPHTGFKLSADGETVLLYDPEGTVISSLSYEHAQPDVAFVRVSDGSIEAVNMAASVEDASDSSGANDMGLYINEVFASGEGSDWVELVNLGSETLDLSGFGLSDAPDKPMKWRFPEGTALKQDQLLVVTLIGKDGQAPSDGNLYADFALSAGETLVLSDPSGGMIDRVSIEEGKKGISVGRVNGKGTLRYFDVPTKGQPNSESSYENKLKPVTFSQKGGAHAESTVKVELTAEDGAAIHYTLDGSKPDSRSPVYAKPLVIRENTLIRAFCAARGYLDSEESSLTILPQETTALRVVCVYGDASGLHSGKKGSGKRIYAEVYEPDGTQLIAQECLMKMAGHASRLSLNQKAFSMRANDTFDKKWFDAALFSNRGYPRYKSFLLRSGGQDCKRTHMKDSIMTALAAATGVYYLETELCTVFVNGEYWGVYNMRERVSPQSLAQFHGWEDWENVNIVANSGGDAYATSGSTKGYHELLSWVKKHDLSREADVAQLRSMMDIENYLEYVALEMFSGNQDLDNVRCYNNPGVDGRWRWMLYDLDESLESENAVKGWLTGSRVGRSTSQDNTLFPRLMKNQKLRDYFLNRAGALLNGAFSADSIIGKIDERVKLIQGEMERNCERWGWSFSTWEKACSDFRDAVRARPEKFKAELIQAFDLTDAEANQYFRPSNGSA